MSQPLWTATFRPADLLAARQAGLRPLGQVMGGVVFQFAAPTDSAVSGELKMLTAAYDNLQRTALQRLRDHALSLGAQAVADLTLTRREAPGGAWSHDNGLVEFIAVGTALAVERPLYGMPRDAPLILTTITPAEWGMLIRSGWQIRGLALGTCAYYQVALPPWGNYNGGAWPGGAQWQNVERTDYTRGQCGACTAALSRLEADAARLGADGIVGVTLSHERRNGGETNSSRDQFYRFTAVGTAVSAIPYRNALEAAPLLTLPLED